MRTPNKQIELALEREPNILSRFWSHIDRSEDPAACWEWTGRCHAGKPAFQVRGSSVAPARIAWLWSTGELPTGGRLYHSCCNALCVRPSHLLWVVGKVMQQRLEAESDGYLRVSGAPFSIDVRPKYWPPIVRVPEADDEQERDPVLPRLRVGTIAMIPSSNRPVRSGLTLAAQCDGRCAGDA